MMFPGQYRSLEEQRELEKLAAQMQAARQEQLRKMDAALQINEESPYLKDVVRRTGFDMERVLLAALRSGLTGPEFHAIARQQPFWILNFVDPLTAEDPRGKPERQYTRRDIPYLQVEIERLQKVVLESRSGTQIKGGYTLYQFYTGLLDLLENSDEVATTALLEHVSSRLAED